MTRYVISVGERWLAALYDTQSSGIALTETRTDACSWVTYERAQQAALQLRKIFQDELRIHASEEPDYPRCWDVVSRTV